MAFQYFLYDTDYGNTIVNRSGTSFTPVPPYAELYADYFIPETQPVYLYKVTGSTIVVNTQTNVENYLNSTELPPTPEGNVTYGEFTGTTAILSASTFNLEATKVNLSGDTMTGTLRTTSNLLANGAVTGSSVCGGVWVHSPFICASTKVQSPIITGSTCVTSPTICAGTCLCSTGTARFTGAVTAASTLNVSGNTTLSATARSVTPATTDCTKCIATTEFVRNYLNTLSGGSSAYYYKECTTICCTTLSTCQKYLGWTGTSLSAGRYQVDVTEQVGQATANRGVLGKFDIDGVTQGSTFQLQMNVTNFTFANTFSRDVTWTAGTHCIDTYYWANAGIACASFASIRVRKI